MLAEIIIESEMGILLESKINPIPLISAIGQNQIGLVKFYFWIGGSPHFKTEVDHKNHCGGESLIHYAADLDCKDIMMLTIENGADVNLKSYSMETPIHRATAAGNQDMVSFLLGCGADIDAQRHDGETALMIAIRNSDPGMVYLLARLGAKVSLTNKKGQNAIDLAQIHGCGQIEQMIIERKAGIELP
jgi:ankyrin repeat protein